MAPLYIPASPPHQWLWKDDLCLVHFGPIPIGLWMLSVFLSMQRAGPVPAASPCPGQPVTEVTLYTLSSREIEALEGHRLFNPLAQELPKFKMPILVLCNSDIPGLCGLFALPNPVTV